MRTQEPAPTSGARESRSWTFLTNHGHVLLCVVRDPDLRIRDLADQVGITERAAHSILSDLIADGYVTVSKRGRRNRYEVDQTAGFKHPLLRDHEIGELVALLRTGRPVSTS